MANEFAGWQKYLHFAGETTWGTIDASPVYVYMPYTSCTLAAVPKAVQAELYTGLRQRKHNRIVNYMVQGQITAPLFGYHISSKSIAERLIEDAISAPAGLFLDSSTIEVFEGDVDNKRWLGCRINQLTLSGTGEGGTIDVTLDIIGKSETGGITEQVLSATSPQPVEFLMADATFLYAGAAIELEAFTITINNQLQPKFMGASTIHLLSNGVRLVNYTFKVVNNANTFSALRRATTVNNATAQLILKGRHQGTAAQTFTQITIDFDRVNFANAGDEVSLNALVSQNVDFIALKPDTTDSEIDFTFGTAA